ncbi:MAG: hypothetical protein CMN77_08375 [Spirochaetaceae bacterium]|nr:hypothetical protein [Spirochaetaceae bacterium]
MQIRDASMDWPGFIQLNFHAISSSTATAFTLFASLFFLISVPRRSAATIHLGLGLMFIGIANTAYIFTSTVYHPLAAFHRYLTVCFVPLAAIHFGHFFWNFPNNPNRKIARAVLLIQWSATLSLTGLFIFSTLNGDRWFRFSAHYWDFAEWELSSYIANLIALFVLMVPGIAIWKMIRNERNLRWTIFWMMLAFLAGTLIPAIANKLSHAGRMSRGNFQVLYNLMTILGFFALIVIYINKTLDRTTFLAKMVGISLVTILVIFQWLSYASYLQAESAYDRLRIKDMKLSMATGEHSPDLLYLIDYTPESGSSFVYRTGPPDFPESIDGMFRVASAFESMSGKNQDRSQVSGDPAVQSLPNYLHGYSDYLDASGNRENPEEDFENLQKELRIRRIQIRMIPDRMVDQLDANLKKWAESDTMLQPFDRAAYDAWKDYIRDNNNSVDAKKQEIFRYYLPVHPGGKRYYRDHPEYGHVICFALPGSEDGQYYEAGYSYLSYRQEQMNVARAELWMLLGCLFVVLVGFRIFFKQTLIDPLQALISGVQKINSGDLKIRLPVQVQDEIGFLTGSFNRMVTSIRRARGQLQDYATTLEDRVEERTLELQDTVKRIQELKTRQDGDFFLTSLLIHPLTSNQVQSPRIRTDMLLLQKKRFAFRRWTGEIGGDFCSAHTIELRGRRCIVFLNGDAMGKSLQGAAGALILGSVFESIIQRTELSREIQTLYPEMWLRDAYLELQKIFCTFDGYMMASMVLGVVEEHSGLMYFLNAEHPWPVLYRNQQATFPFAEQEQIIHKLGIPGAERKLRIYTLQLLPGDIFISGSDGRDDLIIGKDEEGNRIYNMDESAFLSVVEESQAQLPSIQKNLEERGQLSDDLSLLRIELQGHLPSPRLDLPSSARELKSTDSGRYESILLERLAEIQKAGDPVPSEIYRELFEMSFRRQDYEQAARWSEEWMMRQSTSTRYIYLASYALKRADRIEEARIQGERVLLRDPFHANNLVNLADIYRMLGQVDRAEQCIERALELRPGHKSAELIQDALVQLRAEL